MKIENKSRNIETDKVFFKAQAGAEIYSCIRECIAFSAENDTDCVLSHNGASVDISTKKLCEQIYREWDNKLRKK